jgi:hypothetical protein
LHGLVAILADDVAEAVAEARLSAEVPVGPDLVLERDVPHPGDVQIHVALGLERSRELDAAHLAVPGREERARLVVEERRVDDLVEVVEIGNGRVGVRP